MNLFDIPLDKFHFFLLVFVRIWGLMFFAPIFSNKVFSKVAKAGFSFFVSTLLFTSLWGDGHFTALATSYDFFYLVLWQTFIGFAIGFTVKLIFESVMLAGEIIGFQMGLSIVNVIDPQGSSQIPLMAMFQNLFATILFLVIDGHHWVIEVMIRSFGILPLKPQAAWAFGVSPQLLKYTIGVTGSVFVLGVKLAAPILAILIFINVGLGIVARTVPQINIFIVGFPLQISIGFFVISASFSFFSRVFIMHSNKMNQSIYLLLQNMVR